VIVIVIVIVIGFFHSITITITITITRDGTCTRKRMEPYFDHEKLRVYREAIAFVAWWAELAERIPARLSVKDQMDRSSTSMPLNIAEGNGRRSSRERCHYFDIARGSALEAAACLDVLVARRWVTSDEIRPGKHRLHGIVSMLVGLIGVSEDKVAEDAADYQIDDVRGHDHDSSPATAIDADS
jgi:four helix bundle protein